ncbi:MAG: hydantoinase B/oxoprolinase family protein [Desulfobacterales bacterium]|nr:MAG: hydantoinase B/oxoprolinase family protein [Desulfobacterales bacterium]
MHQKNTFKLQTDPADFSVLVSAMFTIAREMGKNMERTARAPIYYSAHDFTTTLLTLDCELLALAEYIPVLIGATPFSARAVKEYFQDDIHEGDVFLVNDPYTLDAGNQMADWCIVYPVFWQGKQVLWVANKAHQQDTGGGVPGGYNPGALDIYGEGLRIPPVKIFERGRERKDVFNLIMTNVRIPDTQRGDLLSMIGAARVGEKRVRVIYDTYGEETIHTFITDLMGYGEFMMREEIAKIADGVYHSEIRGNEASTPIICDLTIDGSEMTVDFTQSGPMSKAYINSPIANTYSSVYMALMTSVGKKIAYRCGGCYRPLKIVTRPGTVTHATFPATHGNCTNFVAKQIIEAVWSALAQAAPQEVPAGWGSINYWVFSGLDPRRKEGYGTPDFLGCSSGAGAIWGTDGWPTNGPQICSGTLYYPEIEVAESIYPIIWEKWEWARDSGAPGKYRGGCGVDNIWVADSDPEPIHLAYAAEPFDYAVAPAIAGGKLPQPNSKKLILADGREESPAAVRRTMLYQLRSGDKSIDYVMGGAGVGNPLERAIEAVREDVRDELVSIESAQNDYGVVIDPATLEVDLERTAALRRKLGEG